jgi:hypothetical protein
MTMAVIIDDLEPSLSLLSETGKAVLAPPCRWIQNVVTAVAREKGWRVVQYDGFCAWARETLASDDQWFVLDPLLVSGGLNLGAARQVRLRRVLQGNEWVVRGLDTSAFDDACTTASFALLDDVAVSGDTLEYAIEQVHRSGGQVAQIAVCVGSGVARKRIAAIAPHAEWIPFVRGDDIAIHLRDACPFIPYSGRPVSSRHPIITEHGPLEVRLPTVSLRVGPWRDIYGDFRVLNVVTQARLSIAHSLTESLGRAATVGDLGLLGELVCVPLYPHQDAESATALSDLARGM